MTELRNVMKTLCRNFVAMILFNITSLEPFTLKWNRLSVGIWRSGKQWEATRTPLAIYGSVQNVKEQAQTTFQRYDHDGWLCAKSFIWMSLAR